MCAGEKGHRRSSPVEDAFAKRWSGPARPQDDGFAQIDQMHRL